MSEDETHQPGSTAEGASNSPTEELPPVPLEPSPEEQPRGAAATEPVDTESMSTESVTGKPPGPESGSADPAPTDAASPEPPSAGTPLGEAFGQLLLKLVQGWVQQAATQVASTEPTTSSSEASTKPATPEHAPNDETNQQPEEQTKPADDLVAEEAEATGDDLPEGEEEEGPLAGVIDLAQERLRRRGEAKDGSGNEKVGTSVKESLARYFREQILPAGSTDGKVELAINGEFLSKHGPGLLTALFEGLSQGFSAAAPGTPSPEEAAAEQVSEPDPQLTNALREVAEEADREASNETVAVDAERSGAETEEEEADEQEEEEGGAVVIPLPAPRQPRVTNPTADEDSLSEEDEDWEEEWEDGEDDATGEETDPAPPPPGPKVELSFKIDLTSLFQKLFTPTEDQH